MVISQARLQQLKKLQFFGKKIFHSNLSGEYFSFLRGIGFEFLQLREYQDKDDIRFLDWNAYAKTGQLQVKEVIPERDRTVVLVLDTSSSMMYGSGECSKAELALDLCYALAWLAIKNHDRVTILIFDKDGKKHWLNPDKDKNQILKIFDLATKNMGQGSNNCMEKALSFILESKLKKSLIFLISDFLEDTFFEKPKVLAALTKHHCVVPLITIDKLEQSFVDEDFLLSIKDPENDETLFVENNSVFRDFLAQRLQDQMLFFKKQQIKACNLFTDQDPINKLMTFFGAQTR